MALWYLMNEFPEDRERFYGENSQNTFPFDDCWHCGRPSRQAFDVFSPVEALSRQLYPFGQYGRRDRFPRERHFQIHNPQAQTSVGESSAAEKAPSQDGGKTVPCQKKSECKDSQVKQIQSRDHPFHNNMLSLREVFPYLQRPEGGPFEMNVHLGDCDPDKLKVEFKNGLLKVEGRKESPDGSFSFVRHERTLPEGVDPSSLKASMLPGGTLKIRQDLQTVDIPVTMEESEGNKEPSAEEGSKKQKVPGGEHMEQA